MSLNSTSFNGKEVQQQIQSLRDVLNFYERMQMVNITLKNPGIACKYIDMKKKKKEEKKPFFLGYITNNNVQVKKFQIGSNDRAKGSLFSPSNFMIKEKE